MQVYSVSSRSSDCPATMLRRSIASQYLSWLRSAFLICILIIAFLPRMDGKYSSPLVGDDQQQQNRLTHGLFDYPKQKTILRKDLSTLPVVMGADKLSQRLYAIAESDLRISNATGVLVNATSRKIKLDRHAIVGRLAKQLDQRFSDYVGLIVGSRKAVRSHYDKKPVDIQVFRHFKECCLMKRSHLRFEAQFASLVNRSVSCDILPPSTVSSFSHLSFYPGKTLQPVYMHNARREDLRWQYFITQEGSHIEYPAHPLDSGGNISHCLSLEKTRHRSQFLSTALPYSKRIVLLVEFGSSMGFGQLEKIKDVTKFLLESFSHRDLVAVVGVSGDKIHSCGDAGLTNATWETKQRMGRFIDRLPLRKETTNHSLGFEEAFRLLSLLRKPNSEEHSFIFYVSRGLLSTLNEAGQVLHTLAKLNVETRLSVQINTFPIMDSGKIPLWETPFLRDVAEQNFSKYSQVHNKTMKLISKLEIQPPAGKMIVVNASAAQSLTLEEIYGALKKPEASLHKEYRDTVFWSEPHVDPAAHRHGQGSTRWGLSQPVISMGLPVWHRDKFGGIVGQDISLGSISAWLRYYNFHNTHTYGFIVDFNGKVIVHPSLSNGIPWPLDVAEMENWVEKDRGGVSFLEGLKQNLRKSSVVVNTRLFNATIPVTYYWQQLRTVPFALVLAIKDRNARDTEEVETLVKTKVTTRNMEYHRLDLSLSKPAVSRHCLNIDQLSTLQKATVFLGPACFKNPFQRLISAREKYMDVAGYYGYLVGTNHVLNKYLARGVDSDLSHLAKIVPFWKEAFTRSEYSAFILRRFVASSTGLLISYPGGGMIDDAYDPTQRDWYRRAKEFPGQIVATAPYLDPSNGGYMVTIAYNIEKTSPKERSAVLGMDVSPSFLYKLLLETMHSCRRDGIRCLLIDDRGYLVASEGRHFNERQPSEKHHLARQEPLLAGDLLNNRQLVRKIVCRRVGDRTIQRMYRFNTEFHDVVKSREESLGCTKFQLVHVHKTNLFFVTINSTCSQIGAAFCPCSVIDRKCLNCRRSDALECECPCECPAEDKTCTNSRNPTEYADSSIPNCELPQSEFDLQPLDPRVLSNIIRSDARIANSNNKGPESRMKHTLDQCLQVDCAKYSLSPFNCYGLIGCEWCSRDDRGRKLTKPYCSSVAACFDGVEGRSPIGTQRYAEEPITVTTPVGPVAGAIMGVFVLLVIGVYCYRYQMTRMVEGRGSHSGSGAHLHIHSSNEDEEEFQFDHDGSKPSVGGMPPSNSAQGVSNHLLASFERNVPRHAVPLPHWRPGPRTESSDHGYSTMTGNCDDSEQATTIEPLTPKKGKQLPFSKRPPSYGSRPNKEDPASSKTKLLLFDADESSNRNSKISEDVLDISGQTIIPDDASNTTLTTTALVHAIDSQ